MAYKYEKLFVVFKQAIQCLVTIHSFMTFQ